jgi:hypothetical protein
MTLIVAAALLVVSIVFTYRGYRRDIAAARTRVSSSRSHVVSTPCGLI